jgi:hypothetical protein
LIVRNVQEAAKPAKKYMTCMFVSGGQLRA